MTSRTRTSPDAPPVEIRMMVPADIAQDLRAISKVSGLATSQYCRSVILKHVARIYATAQDKE